MFEGRQQFKVAQTDQAIRLRSLPPTAATSTLSSLSGDSSGAGGGDRRRSPAEANIPANRDCCRVTQGSSIPLARRLNPWFFVSTDADRATREPRELLAEGGERIELAAESGVRWAEVAKEDEGVRWGLGRGEGTAVRGSYAVETALRPSSDLALLTGALEDLSVRVTEPSKVSESVKLCRRGEACEEAAA